MLGEARLQLSDTGLKRCNLLMQQEVVGLDLGKQGLHERTHGRRCGGPIERRDGRGWTCIVHGGSFADQCRPVKLDVLVLWYQR